MTRSLYRWLLWLHPPAFRERFGEEMLWIYDETAGAGSMALFADGCVSLARQWLTCPGTVTLAAAGFGGALHMALFLVMFVPMATQTPEHAYAWRLAMASGATDTALARFTGTWVGTMRSTGPSGPIELILTKRNWGWVGKLYIRGEDGAMHGGPLEEIQVEGDSLRFHVQAGDADVAFSGTLHQAILTGVLEATANGRHAASGRKGTRIGEGTWVMSPAPSVHATKARRIQS